MSDELQALCFLAGANSIFYGEKLLTTGNPDIQRDQALFARLGLRPMPVPGAGPGPIAADGGMAGTAPTKTVHADVLLPVDTSTCTA
jgi:biotin synthase